MERKPARRLTPGERALWSRSVVSRRGVALACLWLVLAAGELLNGFLGYVVATCLVLMPIVTAAQSWARVQVDERGVRVVQPLLRRALVGVELSRVARARARNLAPEAWPLAKDGVVHTPAMDGYRATPGGESLWLDRTDGRTFVVSVPGAASAAALVTAELDRARTQVDEHRC